MTPDWQAFLESQGARIDNNTVADFGDSGSERAAAKSGSVLADLSHLGLIEFRGEDTMAFLQGQLSNDVTQLSANRAQLSSYNTPKGRMLGNFLLWQNDDAIYMQPSRDLAGALAKRLSMFILRSKVKALDVSETCVTLGIAGPNAAAALKAVFPVLPSADHDVVTPNTTTLIRLSAARYQITTSPELAQTMWQKLAVNLQPAGSTVWRWLDIRAGIPLVTAVTQDQFVPQMANLELIGGVNFKKGCYPGQEIVARTQYRGILKQRMYLAHTEVAAISGDKLYSPEFGEQSCGMVVDAAAAPGGGTDMLVICQIVSHAGGAVRLGKPDGELLRFETLPYAVPEAAAA